MVATTTSTGSRSPVYQHFGAIRTRAFFYNIYTLCSHHIGLTANPFTALLKYNARARAHTYCVNSDGVILRDEFRSSKRSAYNIFGRRILLDRVLESRNKLNTIQTIDLFTIGYHTQKRRTIKPQLKCITNNNNNQSIVVYVKNL